MVKEKSTPEKSQKVVPFCISGNDNEIHLEKKIGQQIFIYGEYLKRKFLLDCNFEKIDGKYKKIEFSGFDDLMNRYESIFGIYINHGNIFTENSNIYRKMYRKYHSLYEIIKNLYRLDYCKLRKKLLSLKKLNNFPDNNIQNYINKDNKSISIILSPYIYERFIYGMSNWETISKEDNTIFGFFLKLLAYDLKMFVNTGTYHVYSEIVSLYHLYMKDLFNIADMERVLNNQYKIYELPRFLNLPKLPLNNYNFRNIEVNKSNPINKYLNISLDFSQQFSITEICEYIKNIIIDRAYTYKEAYMAAIDNDEYRFICSYLDSENSHNSISNFEDRVDGIYLWDRLYLYNSNKSTNSEIEIFIKKFKREKPNSNLRRKFQRLVKNTKICIEQGQILPQA